MVEASDSDRCLRRAEWQSVIFADAPRRADLLRLKPLWQCKTVAVHTYRNHAFEFVASALRPFLTFAGFTAELSYGDYDDALTSTNARADVIVVWLDFERYRERFGPLGLASWMGDRLRAIKSASNSPILVSDWAAHDDDASAFNNALREEARAIPGCHVVGQSDIAARLSTAYFDTRERLTGTRVSDRACIDTARALGLMWIPGVLSPRLKVVAVDLDHTLYLGVLGEEGWPRLVLTEAHRSLQVHLTRLREEGILLAIVSRNERTDVDELFRQRSDFPLRAEQVSAWAVGWGGKAAGLRHVAETLRVGLDSILFIDDNPGELASVSEELPTVHTLHASEDAAATLRALGYYPRLTRIFATAEDALRSDDLRATDARTALARAATDPEEYLRSLDVRLDFSLNPSEQAARIYELSNKTNQFNLALMRMNEAEVAARLNNPCARIVTVHMRDRLSDSGVIALVVATRDGERLRVEDICVSCRALGRGLEDIIVGEAIRGIREALPAARVEVTYTTAPRNAPARDWLQRFSRVELEASGVCELPDAALAPRDRPLVITWSHHDER